MYLPENQSISVSLHFLVLCTWFLPDLYCICSLCVRYVFAMCSLCVRHISNKPRTDFEYTVNDSGRKTEGVLFY